MPYEVLGNEVTIHKDVRVLTDKDGRVTGTQLGLGKIYLKTEVIPDADVAQRYKDILDDSNHPQHATLSKRLKKVSSEPRSNTAVRLGVPFDGYSGMSEDDVVAAMKHLPSNLIQRIKEYEAGAEGQNRDNIVHYNIGYGTDPDARQQGRVGSELEADDSRVVAREDKATADVVTREVPADGGKVEHGEGLTSVAQGKKGDTEGEAAPKVTRNRRGRRDRPDGGSGS